MKKNFLLLQRSAFAVLFAALLAALCACAPFGNGNADIVSESDSAKELTSWVGVQKGTALQDTPLLDANSLEEIAYIAAGEELILCGRYEDRYLCRFETLLGFVDVQSVAAEGEPELIECSFAQPEELSGEAREFVDSVFSKHGALGGSAVVIKNGEIAGYVAYGNVSPNGAECDINTKYRIASVSKILVAMSAAVMDDCGLISYEDDINLYWGEQKFKNPYRKDMAITFEDLLTHTSSVNNISVSGCGKDVLFTRFQAKKAWFFKEAGTKDAWSYSNGGYGLLGASLEMASGETLVEFTDRYFFDALGADASFRAANISESSLISPCYTCAKEYYSVGSMLRVAYSDIPGDNFNYSGSLIISGVDLAKLACILANDGYYNGVYYMSPEAVAEMERVRFELDNFSQCLGLRYCEDLFDERDIYYHNGLYAGVVTLFSYDPATGDGVVVIANGSMGQQQDEHRNSLICVEIAEYLYSTFLRRS